MRLDGLTLDLDSTVAIESGGKDVQHTLKALRYKLFAEAGYITAEGRKNVVKLAIAMRHR